VSANPVRRLAANRSGASALEFAIVGPAFLMMTVAVIMIGWSMNCISSLRTALEVSARALQIDTTLSDAALTTIVTNLLSTIGDPAVSVSVATDTSIAGVTMKQITGTYVFDINVPFLPPRQLTFQSSVKVPVTVS
jgi:Flp pilus assembly protein TadG